MNKSKVTILSLLMALCMVVCTACTNSTVTGNIGDNGYCTFETESLIEKDTTDALKESMLAKAGDNSEEISQINAMFLQIESMDTVERDGKTYYQEVQSKEFDTYEDAQDYFTATAYMQGTSIAKDHFYAFLTNDNIASSETSNETMDSETLEMLDSLGLTQEQLQQMVNGMVLNINMSFSNPVTYSNGTISGNQASWSFTSEELNGSTTLKLYAETTAQSTYENDKTAPSISGIKNNGYYNSATLNVTDKGVGVARILLDNSITLSNKTKLSKSNKEGKHTITVYDFAGNKKTISFTIDATKPTVKGVKNNKTYKKACTITFSDKYGIKSAKLNGKSIKTKKKVSKKGSYTLKVTDKAGNTTTVKFKIKK